MSQNMMITISLPDGSTLSGRVIESIQNEDCTFTVYKARDPLSGDMFECRYETEEQYLSLM
jgi:hypothetical protein